MTCEIGITTDPENAKVESKNKHSSLSSWKVMGTCATRTKALEMKKMFCDMDGCNSADDADGDENEKWHVYKFVY